MHCADADAEDVADADRVDVEERVEDILPARVDEAEDVPIECELMIRDLS